MSSSPQSEAAEKARTDTVDSSLPSDEKLNSGLADITPEEKHDGNSLTPLSSPILGSPSTKESEKTSLGVTSQINSDKRISSNTDKLTAENENNDSTTNETLSRKSGVDIDTKTEEKMQELSSNPNQQALEEASDLKTSRDIPNSDNSSKLDMLDDMHEEKITSPSSKVTAESHLSSGGDTPETENSSGFSPDFNFAGATPSTNGDFTFSFSSFGDAQPSQDGTSFTFDANEPAKLQNTQTEVDPFAKFLSLISTPCFEYKGKPVREIFSQGEEICTAESALNLLTGKNQEKHN